MGRPAKILHIKPRDLWPSTICAGPVTVEFQTSSKGRRVKVTARGIKPRHNKRLPKAEP